LWSLPGGWLTSVNRPRRFAEREVLEETGFQVKAGKLLALYDKARHDSSARVLVLLQAVRAL